jgi:hypothetical protein
LRAEDQKVDFVRRTNAFREETFGGCDAQVRSAFVCGGEPADRDPGFGKNLARVPVAELVREILVS